jgi:hypothetical protein
MIQTPQRLLSEPKCLTGFRKGGEIDGGEGAMVAIEPEPETDGLTGGRTGEDSRHRFPLAAGQTTCSQATERERSREC